jgi:hypothetical protein
MWDWPAQIYLTFPGTVIYVVSLKLGTFLGVLKVRDPALSNKSDSSWLMIP